MPENATYRILLRAVGKKFLFGSINMLWGNAITY